MKQRPLYSQLEEEHLILTLLRERLTELRYDIEFEERRVKIFYAVDFSEVLGFLRISADERDEIDEEITGVNLDREHPEKGYFHYRLGLTHLFNTFSDTLYLLPPHTMELWNYARGQDQSKVSGDEHYYQLLESTRNLDPKYKALLESLWNIETTLDPETTQQLLDFIKSPIFKTLCVGVSDFLNWYKRGSALKDLLKLGKLSYRIDNLITESGLNISELKEPSSEETLSLLKLFPHGRRQFRRSNTLVDCRGLLYLRNINRLLSRINAAILLVTRDTNLIEVVKTLSQEPSFGWRDVRHYIRGIESVFLDLILTDTPLAADKSRWILESELTLASMQESIYRTLLQLDPAAPQHSQASVLTSLGKRVLQGTSQLWEQQINLRLSLASKNIPWLGQGFLESSPEDKLPSGFKEYPVEYRLLRNLFEFLSTTAYQEIAMQDVRGILREIGTDYLRMSFLKHLDKEGAERVSKALSITFSGDETSIKFVLISKRFLKAPSLQFVSHTYQERLRRLQVEGREKYNRVLLSVISEVVSGFDEPEDLMFMAFILGTVIDEWGEALKLVDKCRQLIAEKPNIINSLVSPPEVDYLSSLVKRKIAETKWEPLEKLRGYADSYQDGKRALEARPDNRKYLINIAAIAMLYHETSTIRKRLVATGRVGGDEEVSYLQNGMLTEEEAKALFKRVLSLLSDAEDTLLKVALLNNLAFAEAMADKPSYEEAEVYLRQVDELLQAGSEGDAPAPGSDVMLPHISDTKIMFRARRAKENNDVVALTECMDEFNTLLLRADLTEGEKSTFLSHRGLLEIWLDDLSSVEQ